MRSCDDLGMDGESKPRRNGTSGRRVAVMLAVGVIVALIVGLFGAWPYAPVSGWAAACLVYVAWVWLVCGRLDSEQTQKHAAREDPSRTTSDTLLLLASIASLVALVFVLTQAKSTTPAEKALLASVGIVSVVLSWFFVHTLYMLRYAVLYYASDEHEHASGEHKPAEIPSSSDDPEPVNFNQKTAPRYADFAYLAFTIGMTFQVSDTNLQSTTIRAAALKHALLSYLFGAVILAAAVNLVAGLGS
jgi:uncharacterized membrane protein